MEYKNYKNCLNNIYKECENTYYSGKWRVINNLIKNKDKNSI